MEARPPYPPSRFYLLAKATQPRSGKLAEMRLRNIAFDLISPPFASSINPSVLPVLPCVTFSYRFRCLKQCFSYQQEITAPQQLQRGFLVSLLSAGGHSNQGFFDETHMSVRLGQMCAFFLYRFRAYDVWLKEIAVPEY